MSTPSTIIATHPPHHPFYQTFSDYQPSAADYRQQTSSTPQIARLSYNNYNNNNNSVSAVDSRLPRTLHSYNGKTFENGLVVPDSQPPSALPVTQAPLPDMPPPTLRRRAKKTDWAEFYKNGVPEEVIVIHDSPEPTQRRKRDLTTTNANGNGDDLTMTRQQGKRRKIDGPPSSTAAADAQYSAAHRPPSHLLSVNDSISNSTASRGRTNSALYSTAPTSLNSSTSGSVRGRKQAEASQVGRKRKRGAQKDASEEDEEPVLEVHSQSDAWKDYVPPRKPPIKAQDVPVSVVRDKTGSSTQKHDDDDGHYIVLANTDLTDRYVITKLLGQGTFGKVVEAFDKKSGTKCAIKIIRAIQKYRDASRIELRVLATLASNDRQNRNKCIHYRDCFDFRNHICIVTDLLSSSVFDFLKGNHFTPFPSSHIQTFARQLFTSVAFLHDLNLIHTDLKPENILLVNSAYQTFTYERTIPSSTRSISRSAKQRRVLLNPEIRLIDFGSATFEDEYHSSIVSTRHYRAPEIILNLGWSYPCDIWSIGCILVEFFTGDALFQTHDNLEHLAMMEPVCGGKIEKEIIDKVRLGNRNGNRNSAASYFRPKAPALDYPNPETPRTSRKYVKNMKSLKETIPPVNDFNRLFLDLLGRIFVYDPRIRITAKQALQHPWFKQALQDDGTEALRIRMQKEAAAAAMAHR